MNRIISSWGDRAARIKCRCLLQALVRTAHVGHFAPQPAILLLERFLRTGRSLGGAVAVAPAPQGLLTDAELGRDGAGRLRSWATFKGVAVVDHADRTITQLRAELRGHTPVLLRETREGDPARYSVLAGIVSGSGSRISPLRHYTRRMTEHLGCSGGTAHAMRPQVRPKQQQPIADLRSLITDRGEVVDCQCGREHTVDQLGTEFEFPENMREILREGAGRPRLDVFGPSFLLRINRIAKAGQEDLRIESLHIVFHDDWLVVFEDVDGIGTAWHPAEDNSGRYFAADEAELTLTLIVEAAIDSYDSAALSLEDGTADCESSIFGEFEKDIESVYRLGSDASKVRSSLASLCRFIDRIPAPGASKNSDWSADAAAFAEDADDLLSRVSGIHARLTQLVTVYLALVAQKQNEDMKRISGWAAILFTPSLVGAIYGMNFESIPELTWDFGYPLSILAMVIISAGLYAVFRRQRWL